MTDPPLFIGELEYGYDKDKSAAGLPGTIKLGAWYHAGHFDDQRFREDGLSLANPASSGVARRLRGNLGLYGIIDQMVYRVPKSELDEGRGISVFARLSVSPPDRNLISFYADAGITFEGPLDSRPGDSFGIGFGYAQISPATRGLNQDVRQFSITTGTNPSTGIYTGPALSVRSSEAVVEVTYQAEITRGWTIQPDFQYIVRPGGGISNPRDRNDARVKNAAVFVLRTTIRY